MYGALCSGVSLAILPGPCRRTLESQLGDGAVCSGPRRLRMAGAEGSGGLRAAGRGQCVTSPAAVAGKSAARIARPWAPGKGWRAPANPDSRSRRLKWSRRRSGPSASSPTVASTSTSCSTCPSKRHHHFNPAGSLCVCTFSFSVGGSGDGGRTFAHALPELLTLCLRLPCVWVTITVLGIKLRASWPPGQALLSTQSLLQV